MRLQQVEISNFRSIETATIKFEPRCRILVGKNEVGKTNLLTACSLIDPDAKVVPADLRETRDSEDPVACGYVRFVFDLSTEEITKFKKAAAGRILEANRYLYTSGALKFNAENFAEDFKQWLHIVEIPSGTRYQTHWSKSSYKLEPGWMMPKAGFDPSTQIKRVDGKLLSLGDISLAHEAGLDAESKQHFSPAVHSQVIAFFKSEIEKILVPKTPKCLNWKYAEANLLPPSIDIEAFKANPSSCEPLRAMFLLAGHEDPSQAISVAQARPNGLKNLLTRVARKATDHVKARWKELGTVEIVLSPNGAQIDAAVRDAFNEFSFNRRSDGFKRFMSFLLLVSARSTAKDFSETLFIQDEPDLGLHPTGIKSLLKEIVELSKSNYVLISSHSIFMVDKERIDRHLIVVKKEESTSVLEVDRSRIQDEEVLMNALGYSLFDLVRPRNLVFEGWRDKRLFNVFLKKRSAETKFLNKKLGVDLGTVHAMGVRDIPKVAAYFDAIDRASFVISDSDAVAVDKQRAVLAERPGLVWKRYDELLGVPGIYTAEDFIKPSKLRSSFIKVLEDKAIQSELPPATFDLPVDGGVVASVSAILANAGLSATIVKEILNIWKSSIFDQLEIESIDTSYSKVANGIAIELGYVRA